MTEREIISIEFIAWTDGTEEHDRKGQKAISSRGHET